MKRVLFVGENPLATSGNSNMLAAMLGQLDMDRFRPACLVSPEVNPASTLFAPLPFTIVNGAEQMDPWGNSRLVSLVREADFDVLCMVGIDFWRYLPAWDVIKQVRDAKKFKWVGIFPYDLWRIQPGWIRYWNDLDVPCVYSQYGYDALKPHVPHLRYYRPALNGYELFKPLTPDEKQKVWQELFSTVPEGNKIFGFVGLNQIRKSPERLVKAFMLAKQSCPDITLYLHTDATHLYNLVQIAQDCGAQSGDLLAKSPGVHLSRDRMPSVFGALDCVVNCSMQEGLSWTPLEAMACGTPVIASNTTAQTELVKGAGVLVPCNDLSYVPMGPEGKRIDVESRACRVSDIAEAIVRVATDDAYRKDLGKRGLARAQEWFDGMDDINELLTDTVKTKRSVKKIQAVLFAQHSSAGDVLMSTQCLKGIKERHPNMPLVYMTQKAFTGIVEDNQYIDEVILWDERLLKHYAVVYNPHGTKILPGGWNNLDVTLYSMYPYFCNVEADEMFISPVAPDLMMPSAFNTDYIVVHTTGGSKEYRSYAHMNQVIKQLDMPVVQLGGGSDVRCEGATDLCGKLTWRESAWVMKNAKAAIVVDSFMSHLAGAVGTDAVVLYGPAPARVVQPRMQNGVKLINLEPDMLKVCGVLSHCWSNPPRGKMKCQSPCINTISPLQIVEALKEVL